VAGWREWAKLTNELKPDENGRIPHEAFNAFCETFIANSVNLIPVRVGKGGTVEVLLIWREDKYYLGWHFPGKILLPTQTTNGTLDATVEHELGPGAKVEILGSIGTFDIMKGERPGQNPRGQEVSQVFVGLVRSLPDESPDGEAWEWFPFDSLPGNVISEQVPHLEEADKWVRKHPELLEDPLFN